MPLDFRSFSPSTWPNRKLQTTRCDVTACTRFTAAVVRCGDNVVKVGISEESEDNSSDFTEIPVLSVQINDENGFSEESQAERGVEPYQYEPAAESDSDGVSETRVEADGGSETRVEAASTAVNRDVDRLQSTEW